MNQVHKTNLSYIIDIPVVIDEGKLMFAEIEKHIPFAIKRFYFISDIIPGAIRGMHAHKKTKQMLFCIRGSITMALDNGNKRESFRMDKPERGVFLDAMMWHEMSDFSSDSLLLVVASDPYEEEDYIRDYKTFIQLSGGKTT
ncbi:MAG TPA: FdtA/QdtA family cupin domain-containing protein [Patescibacteria group bacterium]|nr:FdtA/QdtA family cupin domain-containing protein [Patescibacteria group bacterium]